MLRRKLIIVLLMTLLIINSLPNMSFGCVHSVYLRSEQLNQLGLLKGVGRGDYDTLRVPTRAEGVIMIIRLLGKEGEALKHQSISPFKDVPGWASRYIAYAFDNGLTKGVSDNLFEPDTVMNPEQYITFLLRALNYNDGIDFDYKNSKDFAASIGLLTDWNEGSEFLRSDMILLSYTALAANLNGGEKTLATHLMELGVFSGNQWENARAMDPIANMAQNEYEWRDTISVYLSSKDSFLSEIKNAMTKLPDKIIIHVTPGNEEEYIDYIRKNADHMIGFGVVFNMSYKPWSGEIAFTPTYSKGFLSVSYILNPSIPVSEEIKTLAMKGYEIYQTEFKGIISDRDKIKAIHDYIVHTLDYDTKQNTLTDLDHALNDRKATCSGYSAMFQFFAGICGLETQTVFGEAVNSSGKRESHAWNLVKLDSSWRHIDVTWDDPLTNTGERVIVYNYFLLDDATIEKDHTWNRSFYPNTLT